MPLHHRAKEFFLLVRKYTDRHVNSGGRGGHHAPQCLENAIGIGKSFTSLGICLLDEDTFLGKLAMLGQLALAGKPNTTLAIR